jgi:cytochrome c553
MQMRLNLMVQSLHGRAACASAKGSNEECVTLCAQAIKLLQHEAPRDSYTLQRLALNAALAAMSLVAMNRVASAAEYASRSMDVARESGSERAILSAICASCHVEAGRGRPDAAIAQLESIRQRSLMSVGSHHEYLRTAIVVFERASRPDAALSAYRSLMQEIQRGRSAGMRHALTQARPESVADSAELGKSDRGPQLSHFAARTRALLSRARFSVAKL